MKIICIQKWSRIQLCSRVARWFVFKPKIPNWVNFGMENLGIYYDHLVYFTSTGNILRPSGIFCGNLVYFSPFWYFGRRKIWQPCCAPLISKLGPIQFTNERSNGFRSTSLRYVHVYIYVAVGPIHQNLSLLVKSQSQRDQKCACIQIWTILQYLSKFFLNKFMHFMY
jgi:hypothetical protein